MVTTKKPYFLVTRVAKTITISSITCPKCDTTFSKASDLHMHTIKEHPGRLQNNYIYFGLLNVLVVSNKVTTLPPTKCDICKIKFRRPTNLKRHLERKHPGMVIFNFLFDFKMMQTASYRKTD